MSCYSRVPENTLKHLTETVPVLQSNKAGENKCYERHLIKDHIDLVKSVLMASQDRSDERVAETHTWIFSTPELRDVLWSQDPI